MCCKGKNGSGKSAVLTGIVVALGERASATCRGQSIKGIFRYVFSCVDKLINVHYLIPLDFVKTGKSKAVVSVTLINKGKGSYKRNTFGDTITIERTINASGSGGYRILNEHRIIHVNFFKVLINIFLFNIVIKENSSAKSIVI